MVMAIIAIAKEKLDVLQEHGVDDSKKLSKKKREIIYNVLNKHFENEIAIIPPKKIDEALISSSSNLNILEGQVSSQLFNKLNSRISIDEVYLDCPSINIENYSALFKKSIKNKSVKIIVEHKADENYLIVGAASILAKVTRDNEIEKIKNEIGHDFGSGYPSDPKTIAFLKKYYKNYDIFRKTWSTYQKITSRKNQKTLF
ncbi:MAG: ribonuclease HII [Candidatus Lokiarchaeota archaeon]|nr:ribonuclease HII [Candidatus Lokiarchaeota archaeon]